MKKYEKDYNLFIFIKLHNYGGSKNKYNIVRNSFCLSNRKRRKKGLY